MRNKKTCVNAFRAFLLNANTNLACRCGAITQFRGLLSDRWHRPWCQRSTLRIHVSPTESLRSIAAPQLNSAVNCNNKTVNIKSIKTAVVVVAVFLLFALNTLCLSACTDFRSKDLLLGSRDSIISAGINIEANLNTEVDANSNNGNNNSNNGSVNSIADNNGYDANKTAPQRVVALSSSLAEMWLLAGGNLIGTSSDTLERDFININNGDNGNTTGGGNSGISSDIGNDIAIVGTVKDPGLEAILDLQPDFVILSADLAGHTALKQALTDAGIEHLYVHVETFADYYTVLETFCNKAGNSQMFVKNGIEVKESINRMLDEFEPPASPITYLLLRVHSSGGKVIAGDHVVCDILSDLGAVNIAASNQSLLSDLSLEVILESDPDIIYVVTMGDEEAALKTLEQMFSIQPVWQKLSAVINNRVHLLPKDLFHYKPNAKWGQAYETIIGSLAN